MRNRNYNTCIKHIQITEIRMFVKDDDKKSQDARLVQLSILGDNIQCQKEVCV